jgi:hypothetical protein
VNRVSAIGRVDLQPGDTVEVDGLGVLERGADGGRVAPPPAATCPAPTTGISEHREHTGLG